MLINPRVIRVLGTLADDMASYGSMRYLVTNNREEYAIQRIHPDAIITVEMED